MPDNANLTAVITWLITGGAGILGGAFVSFLAEQWPAFGARSKKFKQWAMVGASVGLALAAWAIQKYVPAETLAALAEPFRVAVTAVLALLGTQAYHALVNKNLVRPKTTRLSTSSAPIDRSTQKSLH